MQSLPRLQPHLLQSPTIGAKITLEPISDFACLRIIQYGSIWIIRSFSVYDPFRIYSSDPYNHLIGLLTLSVSPIIDLPQLRKIGFPIDRDFSWNYLFKNARA